MVPEGRSATEKRKPRIRAFFGLFLAYLFACCMQFACLAWIAVSYIQPVKSVAEIFQAAFGEFLPWISGWLAVSQTLARFRDVGEAAGILFALGFAVGLPACLYVRYARLIFWLWLAVGLGVWFFLPVMFGMRLR